MYVARAVRRFDRDPGARVGAAAAHVRALLRPAHCQQRHRRHTRTARGRPHAPALRPAVGARLLGLLTDRAPTLTASRTHRLH